MRFEEAKRIRDEVNKELTTLEGMARPARERLHKAAAGAERIYHLDDAAFYKAEVNPVYGHIYCGWCSSVEVSRTPAAIWVALGEVMTMFELWKAGQVDCLPPSGLWAEVGR